MKVVLLCLLTTVVVVSGCATHNDCGIGFFCGAHASCTMCQSDVECGGGCRCSFGSCICDVTSAALLENLTPPSGNICETNSRCSIGEYCRIQHCLINSALNGCRSTPIQGACATAPQPIHYASDSASDMDWEVAFAIVVSLLGVLLCLALGALCCYKKRSAGEPANKNTDTTTTTAIENNSIEFDSRCESPPHRMYEVNLSTSSHNSEARNYLRGDQVLWITKGHDNRLGVTYEGTAVISVEPGGPADLAGLQPGMEIRTIKSKIIQNNNKAVASAFKQALKEEQPFMISIKNTSYIPGDRVDVLSQGVWFEGTVTDLKGDDVIVLPDGWGKPSVFEAIRKHQITKYYPVNGEPTSAKDLPPTPAIGNETPRQPPPYHLRPDAIPTPLKPPRDSASISDKSEIFERELSAFTGMEPPSPLVPGVGSPYQPGDVIMANFNGIWGSAVVVSSYPDSGNVIRYTVDWPDATRTHDLYADDLRKAWPIGVSGQGLYHGQWYPCTIESFEPTSCTYTVNWADKTATSGVSHDDIKVL